ncbi:acyl-CoA N-acyltransferase [Powellomyces hirtus]|nr:acyl-CoA N-acyltransferase [Powellomyces hirtus]
MTSSSFSQPQQNDANENGHHISIDQVAPTAIPLNPTDPSFVAECVKCMDWDEHISMAITHAPEHRLVRDSHFASLLHSNGVMHWVFEHRGHEDALAQDLKTLVTGARKGTKWHIPSIEAFSNAFLSKPELVYEALQASGFERSAGLLVRYMSIIHITNTPLQPLPCGITARLMDAASEYEQRVQLESDIFGYPPNGYVDRLRAALRYMMERGDRHWMAWSSDGKAVGYITLRTMRGIAYIQGAGVLSEWKMKGIMRYLLALANREARRLGFHYTVLTAWNEIATAAWTAMGFTEVAREAEAWSLTV